MAQHLTPQIIAKAAGCSSRTIRRYLAERFPRRSGFKGANWRLEPNDLPDILADLKSPDPGRRFGLKRRRESRWSAQEAQ